MAQSEETKTALMQQAVTQIQEDTREIKSTVKEMRAENAQRYVTKEEFELVKRIVYGMVSLILVSIATAGMNALINR